VSISLSPGSRAHLGDAARAQERYALLRTELMRVRAAAVAWRNGLAGMLAAVVGFSLIRGRADIGELAPPWNIVVGVFLLAALLAGAAAGMSLLRAANGRPGLTPVDAHVGGVAAEHIAAVAALRDLARGIGGLMLCTALLVAAVATTWYGPERSGPQLQVVLPGTTVCGTTVRLDAGRLTIATRAGQMTVDVAQALAVQPVTQCP